MNKHEKGYFGYWLKNVLWYHYKYWILGGLAALAVVLSLSLDLFGSEHYDFNIVIVTKVSVSQNYIDELRGVVENAVGDLNKDGEVLIHYDIIDLSDAEHVEENQNRIMLALALDDNPLFILGDSFSASYCQREFFDDLSEYGIEPDAKYKSRVYLSGTPLFKREGLEDGKFYACLCDWTKTGKGSKKETDAAVRVIKAFLSTP